MTASSRHQRERSAKAAIAAAEQNLADARRALEALSLPADPGPGQYSIDVRFQHGGSLYTFLVLIAPSGHVYTTGVKDSDFNSFDEFVEWLRAKEPYTATNLHHVKKYGTGVGLL